MSQGSPPSPSISYLSLAQITAITSKLDSLSIRDLEARVATCRENIPGLKSRVQELLGPACRPGAQPEVAAAYTRAKQELDRTIFLLIKAQEILHRKRLQEQIAQANAQSQARTTPIPEEHSQPRNPVAGQAPAMPGWQQPGPSTRPQMTQGSPSGSSSTPFQPVPSAQPILDHAQAQAAIATNGTGRQTVIPRDRTAFLYLMRMWFVQTGRTSDAIPKFGGKPLDLHQLYIEVETLGGSEKVQAAGLWRLVAIKMGYFTREQNDSQLPQTAKILADAYVAFIVPFDSFCLERMRTVGNGVQNNPLNLGLAHPAAGMGAPGGLQPGASGMLSGGDGVNSMANLQRTLALVQFTLKDWLPNQSPQFKLLRASQMDVAEMEREGWPADRISVVQRFRPALLEYRVILMRQQELQRLSLQRQQQQMAQVQAQAQGYSQQSVQQPQQAWHVNGDDDPTISDTSLSIPTRNRPLASRSSLSSDDMSTQSGDLLSLGDKSPMINVPSNPTKKRKLLDEQPLDDDVPSRRGSPDSSASSSDSNLNRQEKHQVKKATKRQRGLGADDAGLAEEVASKSQCEDMLLPGVDVSAGDRLTAQVIGHTTPLATIMEHLAKHGCPDVSLRLKNIDEHSKYSGGLSDVYQARWPDGSLVAVKCLRALSNSDVPPGKLLKQTARELYAWSRASHPNVLKLHGLALVRGKLAMIAPWMKYSSLLVYIRAQPQVDRCRLCTQIAAGLSYMHNSGLVHGDVKGNNVVVSEDGIAKITDFGSATMAQEFAIAFTATQTVNYSIRWAAPELFMSQSPSFESDVYAFAKTVLEALTGDIPHKQLNDFAIMRHVGLEGKLPDRPLEYIPPQSKKGDELWNMLIRCWDTEPTQRPKIDEMRTFMDGVTQGDLQVPN